MNRTVEKINYDTHICHLNEHVSSFISYCHEGKHIRVSLAFEFLKEILHNLGYILIIQ